jgi:hypothetical protein
MSKQTPAIKDTPSQTNQHLQQNHSTYSPEEQKHSNRTTLPFQRHTKINNRAQRTTANNKCQNKHQQ